MRLYISLSLAIVALLAHFNNAALQANCPQDIVFVVDASQSTSGRLYVSFISSLRQFVDRNEINNNNIRVAVVFMNDQAPQKIDFNGNRNALVAAINNQNNLGSNLLIGSGLQAALELLNFAGRPTVKKTVIVVTANPSRNNIIPLSQANLLKRAATVYTIGVAKLVGGIEYNVGELNAISTSNSRIQVAASNNIAQQASLLLNEYDTISNTGCGGGLVTPGINVAGSVCDACLVENGVGYVTYKNPAGVVDGRYFVQCKKEDFGNGFIANVLRCPDSLFWHNDLKNCVGLTSSDDYQGQCDSGTYVFASVSCGAYFNCTDGQVKSECCPANTGFDENQGRCVTNSDCEFHCSDSPTSRAVAPCDKGPVIMANGLPNPCKFKWTVGDGVSYDMPCAAGTNFNQTACSCTIHSTDPCPGDFTDHCNSDLNINFNSNQVADTRGSTVVNKGGVSVSNGVATFNGQNQQRLSFMRYTNIDFALPLAIKIKYRETENRQNMTLLATGDCLSRPGLYILVGNGQVTLGLHTETDQYNVAYETSASAPGVNQWKEVVFHFDGRTLQGEIRTLDFNGNSIASRSPIPPRTVSSGEGVRILETEGAMVLGYSHETNYPGYVGDVDEINVWKACTAKTSPSDF